MSTRTLLNTDLLNYIKLLTERDTKTLSQKTLKLSEEQGELSSKVLPYEGAAGTNHRMATSRSILEECADIFLVNQSIVFDLGFTMEEFQDMVFKKAQVWNGLQVQEGRAFDKFDKLPFEIHVTISNKEGINIDQYKADCKQIGVKPILLALQDKDGSKVMDDVMTSSNVFGHNGDAMVEMERITAELKAAGYTVVRQKIESSYWHPKAPFERDTSIQMPKGCYFECHLNLVCCDDILEQVSASAKLHDCHLSKNAFKSFEDGSYILMLTVRSYEGVYEDFEARMTSIKADLVDKGIKWEKEIVEFSVYDTKVAHDNLWTAA